MPIVCPICTQVLTEYNLSEYYVECICKKYAIKADQKQNIRFERINVGNFIVNLHYQPTNQTVIYGKTSVNKINTYIMIMRLDKIIDLPWHNQEESLDKLKTYLLFS